jgi:serine/threonine protein kinase
MHPEQAQGRPVHSRFDIFSFGIVLYEMTTGRRPFSGDNTISILSSLLRDTPAPIMQLTPSVPPPYDRIANPPGSTNSIKSERVVSISRKPFGPVLIAASAFCRGIIYEKRTRVRIFFATPGKCAVGSSALERFTSDLRVRQVNPGNPFER